MNKISIYKKVIKVLFNPCSPLITLLVGWLLTLLATSNTNLEQTNLHWFVKELIDRKDIILIILVFWFILAVMYTNNEEELNRKNEQILILKKEVDEKAIQLNQSSGIILNKYGEFAKFNKKNRFNEVLKSFVENNESIDSAQVYKYSAKFTRDNVKIKVEYEEGYAYEGVDINNILQTYYLIDKNDYKTFQEIVIMWKRYISEFHNFCKKERDSIENTLLNNIEGLLTKIHNNLNSIQNKEAVTDEDFDNYRLLLLLVRMLDNNDYITEITNLLDNSEVEEFLNNGKRTGVLGSILLEDAYIFKHVGNSSKNGRVYVCFNIEVYNHNYIVLFAIPPGELDDEEEWKYEFERMKNDFIKRLKSTSTEQE